MLIPAAQIQMLKSTKNIKVLLDDALFSPIFFSGIKPLKNLKGLKVKNNE